MAPRFISTRTLDAEFADRHQRNLQERMREKAAAVTKAADEQTMRVRVSLMWSGVRQAVETAPDAWPGRLRDPNAQYDLAAQIVNSLIAD